MPARLATAADAAAIVALYQSVRADIEADYGSFGFMPEPQDVVNMLDDTEGTRIVLFHDAAAVLRGATYLRLRDDGWQAVLVATDGSLTAARRAGTFAAMEVYFAGTVPPQTVMYGIVRVGRRLDIAMAGLADFTRTLDSPTMARFTTTAGAVLLRLAAMAGQA